MCKILSSKARFCSLLFFLPLFGFSQCLVLDNNLAGGVGLSGDIVSIAQGFIAECDGKLEYAQFLSSSNATTEVFGTFNLYEGNGLDGTLIHTESYASGIVLMLNDPIRATLENEVALIQGNQYTFELVIDNQVGLRTDSEMTYLGGSAFSQGFESQSYDFNFEVSLEPILGTQGFDLATSLVVYPNPSRGAIQVSGLLEEVSYELYDSNGSEIRKGTMAPDQLLNTENLATGLYFLTFENGPVLSFLKE